MSKHDIERRQCADDNLPAANRIPVYLADLGIRKIIEYGVASWCRGRPDGAVVLHMTIETVQGDLKISLFLKSPRAVDEMIAELERHRNDVWPGQ